MIKSNKMYYQLSRLSLSEIKQVGYKTQFSGSSRYKSWNNQLFDKVSEPKSTIIEKMENEAQEVVINEKINSGYKLKKNKIRNKILNFFSLNASKKFCAFYTITFPIGIDDDLAYKLLNTWLTRCRQLVGLKSYLWVAERQKNNTLHFHLITNNYMQIGKVNEFMKISLMTEWQKGNIKCRQNVINRYNGIDVDNLYKPKNRKGKAVHHSKAVATKKLSMYLSKYVSKNDTVSKRLPWHCSRDISALFISINYQDISALEIADLIDNNPDAVVSYFEEYFTVHFFKFIPLDEWFKDLININNQIYEKINFN